MTLAKKIESLIKPILEHEEIELVDIEHKKEGGFFILRVLIDKEGGVSIDDCGDISSQISGVLDIEEAIQNRYTLEVSSPGIERPLKKISDYMRFLGREVSVKLYSPAFGQKKVTGAIKRVENETVILNVDKIGDTAIHIKDIAKANLKFDFREIYNKR